MRLPLFRPGVRATLGVLLAAAATSAPASADSDELSALCHLESSPVFPTLSSTLTVRSPLVGAQVFVGLDDELGPVFAGDSDKAVLQLSDDFLTAGAGTIDASGRFAVTVPVAIGVPLFAQAVVVDASGLWHASTLVPLLLTGAPLAFADGTAGLDPLAGGYSSIDADWLDFDRDGCNDVIVSGTRALLLKGDCSGSFTRTGLHRRLPFDVSCAEVADVNGDGWADLFIGGGFDARRPLANLLLVNDGKGDFLIGSGFETEGPGFVGLGQLPDQNGSAFLPPGHGVAVDAEFGDVDGDGDVDLFVCNVQDPDHPSEMPDPVTLYLNQGGLQGGAVGRFLEDAGFGAIPENQPHVGSGALSLADVDGDADLDLFVCSSGGQQPRLYVNDGSGDFTDVTDTALPVGMDESFDASFADFDADGDVDMVVANNAFSDPDGFIDIYRNETTVADAPVFVDGSAALPSNLGTNTLIRTATEVGDVDLDGDVDILFGIHELPGGGGPLGTDGHAVLLLNLGGAQGGVPGTFIVSSEFEPGIFIDGDLSLGDADGDGDPDVYMANVGNLFQFDFHDELWLNDRL